MSKKQLHSRLDQLFSTLGSEASLPPDPEPAEPSGPAHPDAASADAASTAAAGGRRSPAANGGESNGRGTPPEPAESSSEITRVPVVSKSNPFGFALELGTPAPAAQVWTDAGRQSLSNLKMAVAGSEDGQPAAMAVPLQMQGIGDLLLEIVDDSPGRIWSEDDRLLVMEISAQLALALDNAQLYRSVQQELAERIRAEQATLRRNRGLAMLNKIGQQLSRLVTRAEIFDLLSTMIGEVLDNRNLYICMRIPGQDMLTFPVFRFGGQPVAVPDRPFSGGVPEYVITNQKPLLLTENTAARLERLGLELCDVPPGSRAEGIQAPASLAALPLIAGDRSIGAVVIQDMERENAFDDLQVELLSTAAAQATTALENAGLFQQMQAALAALETRERYQASVARAAAALTEAGTQSLGEVLKALGQAAGCGRVYYCRLVESDQGSYWRLLVDWVDPATAYRFDKTRIQHIPVSACPNWLSSLREPGWCVTRPDPEQTPEGERTPEGELLAQQRIRSGLLLAVQSSRSIPDLLAFDQLDTDRAWQNEEINALRVAADAISNTFIREGLLDQVQATLNETEELYRASNRLALASDMQEMVAAVLSAVRSPDINRAVLLSYEFDSLGKIAQMTTAANWYNGRGAPPPPVGTTFGRVQQDRFFQPQSPSFYDDIEEAQSDPDLLQYFRQNHVRSLALLPMRSGKQHIGSLLLLGENRHHFQGRERRTYPPLVDQMAIAVENLRLFEQTQTALSETELLYSVNNRIAQATGAQDMLALIVETVLPAGADRASMMMIESDPEGELVSLDYIGAHTVNGAYQPAGVHMPVSSLPVIKSLTDEPLLIPDIYALDPASRETLARYGMAAACIVPLRTSGRLMGLICASSTVPIPFSIEDARLLRVVGNAIAVAMDKQRLLRQAQRRALELQTASEIARDTASTLSLDLLLNRIVNMLLERFEFYHAALYLLDDTRSYAVLQEAAGDAGKDMKKRDRHVAVGSRSVVGEVTQTGEPLILNDVQNHPLYQPHPLLPDTRSEVGIPLKLGATMTGALDLRARESSAFNPDDVTVLQILADQIAIAIENARAYGLSQKAIADMKEIDRVKSQFLANMSHELRTPLNSIIGFSRVILKGIDGPINETQSQDLAAIYNSGQHLLSLINDILDLSKIEAGKMELAFSEVNLADLINSAMSTAIGLVKDKPIKLKTIIPDQLPLVRADNTRVRQVLINFLSNAAKFTDEGTITVEAAVIHRPRCRPEVMITVADTGPGIAPADQAKLFLPFSQVDDSPTRKTGGTGLGLSICRSLVEMHNGRIGLLRSEVGRGSTFFFTLPFGLADTGGGSAASDAASSVVLCIDDDTQVINLYERYLNPHGYQVVALPDPQQAVQRVKELRPAAVTLDVMMPGKDGWQVLRELKNNPETQAVPVIVCSILENPEQGLSMGAAGYLVKPFLPEELLNAVSELIQNEGEAGSEGETAFIPSEGTGGRY